MEITGKIIHVSAEQSGTSKSGNPFRSREFVIETQEQYPKKVCIALLNDKVDMCPQVGEVVKVKFDINAREYNGRWFNSINAWAIDRPQANTQASAPQPAPSYPPQSAPF